jgi:hypothetical protein
MNKLFLKLRHAHGVTLGAAVLAVLAAGQLKADLVVMTAAVGGGGGTTSPPPYYVTLGGQTCTNPPNPDPYTCFTSHGTMISTEPYVTPMAEATNPFPGPFYVAGPGGNVDGVITASIDGVLGCSITNPTPPPPTLPLPLPCSAYFTLVTFTYQVGPTGQTCAGVGGCIPIDNYQLQTLDTITYGGQSPPPVFFPPPDAPTTLEFQYTTPEPGFLIPLGIGLGVTGFALRKKALARHL